MAKKRANGEGWIKKTEDGGWMAGGMVSLPDGSKKRIKFQAQTQKEALKKFREAKAKYEGGLAVARTLPSLAEYLESWLVRDCRTKSASSTRRMRYHVKSICAVIGTVRLDRLTFSVLRDWIHTSNQQYAPSTVHHQRTLLQRALEDAVLDNLITRNPINKRVSVGASARSTVGRALSMDEITALLAASRGHWYELVVYCGVFLGLRRGEIAGLRWNDIDMEARTVHVTGQIVYTPETGAQRNTPKAGSDRVIPVPEHVLHRMQFHQFRQRAERLSLGLPPAEYVFEIRANLCNPTNVVNAFKQIAKRAGVNARLHDLRHTAATLMIQAGATIPQVSAALGHRRLSTTLDVYTHVTADDASHAIHALAALLQACA